MNHLFDVDALLTPDESTGQWTAWCPNLDVVTCGINPEHAVGMLMDAVRLTCEDDLDLGPWNRDVDTRRVRHPLRRGATARLAVDWPAVLAMRDKYGTMEEVAVSRLSARAHACGLVLGAVQVQSRAGVVHCAVFFHDSTFIMASDDDQELLSS